MTISVARGGRFFALCSALLHFFAAVTHGFNIPHLAETTKSLKSFALHSAAKTTDADPLLLRAARGEMVERVPVWMMRQAGRHMKVYQELCKKHKTFRERSENAELATEIR